MLSVKNKIFLANVIARKEDLNDHQTRLFRRKVKKFFKVFQNTLTKHEELANITRMLLEVKNEPLHD